MLFMSLLHSTTACRGEEININSLTFTSELGYRPVNQ
jgi:hypothetical protein